MCCLTRSDPTSHSICPCWHTKPPVKQSCILSKGYLTQEACLTSRKDRKKKGNSSCQSMTHCLFLMKRDTNSHLHWVGPTKSVVLGSVGDPRATALVETLSRRQILGGLTSSHGSHHKAPVSTRIRRLQRLVGGNTGFEQISISKPRV